MFQGSIIGNLDVAQLMVIVFFIFFAGLVLYLRREDKREGYPLKDPADGRPSTGFPDMPPPKTFRLLGGGAVTAPHAEVEPDLAAQRLFNFPGSPITPTGDPLRDGVGPAAYVLRREEPMIYQLGMVSVLPMRSLKDWSVIDGDADPRGMEVIGADGVVAGVVRDLWIDRGVKILRYLEVELAGAIDGRSVLLPIYCTDVKRKRSRVKVSAIRAAQFAEAPRTADPDRITAREEDQVNAFYAGGRFFNTQIGNPAL
jgi:photosynthetic reaction center H subunit